MAHNVYSSLPELEKINKNGIDKDISANNDGQHYESRLPFRRQAVISFGVFSLTLGAGATIGISAILITQLQLTRNDLSTEMMSWVASTSSLALFFGNLISGYSMERLGRRLSQLLLATCFISGWLIIGFSSDILYLILAGRFVTGLCQGWLGPLGPVFIGEIASPIHRGLFLAAISLAIAVGIFFAHLFGTFLHWRFACMLCGLFPLIGGIIIYNAPESPAWLASRNRIDECVVSFYWYRGRSPSMKTELEKMLMDLKIDNKTESKMQALAANIKRPEFYKPLVIMIVFFLICQLTGVNVISAYTTDVMKELIGNDSDASNGYIAMLSVDILRCVAIAVACILLRTLGRRPIALNSGVLTSVSLISLALYLYLNKINVIKHMSTYISLGLMAFYIAVSNMGIALLPWNMVGELFAVKTKGIGSGISVMMTSLAFFGTVKAAPAMFKSIGYHGTYLFYGLATACGTLFLFFYLPETKNKTLLEIEENFRHGKRKDYESAADNIQ